MIQTTEALATLVTKAKECDAIALDTEFVWERTYYPKLGIIQIAFSDEDCQLIDPNAINDLDPLNDLLADRKVVKILHDAPQDLAILHHATGTAAQNVFDTRLAAGFAGLPATLSLSNLIKELLDIELAKTETRTDWLQRPLDEKQIDYALDDVRYLRALRILLLSRIVGPKIKSWLQEELNLLNNPKNYLENGSTERYRKLRGANKLDSQSLAILKNLYLWREEKAQIKDRPRGHILKDATLVHLARKKTETLEGLEKKMGFSPKAIKRYAKEVTTIITETLNAPEESYPIPCEIIKLTAKEKAESVRLHKLIQLKSKLLDIDPSLIGNTQELKELIRLLATGHGQKQLRQTEGWRKSFLADFFRQKR